jgi:uncharacterized Zn finger protein (UPF0148 family)
MLGDNEAGILRPGRLDGPEQEATRLNDCGVKRAGEACPECRQGILEYNGMLDLVCPQCGYHEPGGAFT